MNPQPGQQPYDPYGYYRRQPEPPQPQWQAPPAASARPGWNDPRLQQPAVGGQPAQQSPNHNPHAYNNPPPTAPQLPYRPPGQDISAWGVKYNHPQEPPSRLDPLPPLPPRPPSTNARPASHEAHQPVRPTNRWQDPRSASPAWQTPSYAQQQSHPETPPAPPPRPPQYQQQQQYYDINAFPHVQNAHRPSTSHKYEPPPQNNWQNDLAQPQPVSPQKSYVPSRTPAPYVSPVESQTGPWSSQNTTPYAPQRPTVPASSGAPSSSSQTASGDQSNANEGKPAAMNSQAVWQSPTSDWEHLTPTASKPEISKLSNAPLGPGLYAEPDHNAERDEQQLSRPSAGQASSDTTTITTSGIQRTGTIDSLINAWSTPIDPQDTTSNDRLSKSPSTHSSVSVAERRRNQHDESNAAPVPKMISHAMQNPSSILVPSDPYADLEPEHRASLARYLAMLRKEASAPSDDEKYRIFESFMKKELRLRAVMYDVEPDAARTVQDPSSNSTHAVSTPQPLEAQPSQSSDRREVVEQTKPTSTTTTTTTTNGPTQPMLDPQQQQDVLTPPPSTHTSKAVDSPSSNDDSFVVVDRDEDDVQYSPGGRPIIPSRREQTSEKQPALPTITTTTLPTEVQRQPHSPSDDAPQVVSSDYMMPGPASSPAVPTALANLDEPNRPKTTSAPSQLPPTIKFEPARPVYTPFRYQEKPARFEGRDRRELPADEAYTSLRKEYADSDRLMAQNIATTPKQHDTFLANATAGNENAETFLGLIREHSRLYRKGSPAVDALRQRAGTPRPSQSPIADAVLALRNMIPANLDTGPAPNQKLNELQERVNTFSDDFSFIRETVIQWDRTNREVRANQDAERHERQAELEAENNSRFEAKEITYSQVAALEDEFQLEEAERKYKEDQEELASFTSAVFTSVTDRLQREISELNVHYIRATDLLDLESDAASRLIRRENGKAAMASTMDVVLSLFGKLDIRHRKVAEAQFELERRRKQLEQGVLKTNDDQAGLAKLEQDFATAQKLQILHEAQEHDTRANKLMDLFDRATIRGLGDNQTFTDDLVTRIKKLRDAIFNDNDRLLQNLYGENGARQTLTAAHTVLNLVLADSRAILTISNTADTLLNDADYRLSIAEAQVAHTDAATYQKLQREKAKEDAKLLEEQDMRLRSIADTPAEGVSLIKEIVAEIGDDPDHHERIRRALEDAKRRNMDKASGVE